MSVQWYNNILAVYISMDHRTADQSNVMQTVEILSYRDKIERQGYRKNLDGLGLSLQRRHCK